ncbi:Gfo/Idh/MocA family oxidoreductase [bacterium]|nr:Gfo/Idh/MocA family oxidoreductase [bacterium]
MNSENKVTRNKFMNQAIAAGATLTLLGATAKGQGKVLKIGLIGCGGRGKGAIVNHLNAAGKLGVQVRVTALADYFDKPIGGAEMSPLALAYERFKADGVEKANCFGGMDGYKKLLATDIDIVAIATPPIFRPAHVEEAVRQGKHIFLEKPVGVDAPGCHRIIAAGEEGKKNDLAIIAGTQRRHSAAYRKVHYYLTEKKLIGDIIGGMVGWCQGAAWYKDRLEGESDQNYMVRNWMNYVQMAADHIVEQHVHNIDIANWFIGSPPMAAVGFGGRARRKSGNTFDFFSVDYEYPGGVHIHSMCRQVNSCWNREFEYFVGTEGKTYGYGGLRPTDKAKKPSRKDPEVAHLAEAGGGPYVQEHIVLLENIVKKAKDKPRLNQAEEVAHATLSGIMGRIAAYTGTRVTWQEMMEPGKKWCDYKLSPSLEDFEKGTVKVPPAVAPVPGK